MFEITYENVVLFNNVKELGVNVVRWRWNYVRL